MGYLGRMRFLRRSPLLYDAAKSVKRTLGVTTPISRFLKQFSDAHGRRVNFVQIGASDGLRNDPIREFVVRHRWSGILVEPLPGVFDLLRRNYRRQRDDRLAFINAAVAADTNGSLTFWTIAPAALGRMPLEKRLSYLRKSSLDRDHVLRWVNGRTLREDDVVSVQVPSLTLSSLLERHWRWGHLHLLAIDVEGYDLALLQSIDFGRTAPDAILYESQNLREGQQSARELLEYHGYQVTAMGEDTVAVLKGTVSG
ncbi:MAG TPA: FkbM family methyltransferase [Longimicrobiales bacterium]|nr:FkbM family methyltransferase [Longimicrobiales bacterium]